MIRVEKPISAPPVLKLKGDAENVKNCNAYGIDPKTKFTILNKIYNNPVVKKSLKKAQHNKCCFCEKKQNDEFGAVEHYRPKGGYKSERKEKIKKPGYYWQGYSWENLFFVCGPCNTKKGNIFPLEDETKRATDHTMKIQQEKPLLLNPNGKIDPRKHIEFINEIPIPKGGSKIGQQTIEVCKLDRQGLNEERKILLNEIEDKILILSEVTSKLVRKRAYKFLIDCQKSQSKYSAVAIDYLKGFTFV